MASKFNQHNKLITKYLSHYGEVECQQLDKFPGEFKQGLIVPIYREEGSVLERFRIFACSNPKTLLILVINRPDNDDNKHWARTFFDYSNKIHWQSTDRKLTLLPITSTKNSSQSDSAILLVDRCIEGDAIPKDQGVGLARKIGADILSMLINNKKVLSHWIFNTDADAYLPEDYFLTTQQSNTNTAAIIYPFEHIFLNHYKNDSYTKPLHTLLYEFSLHYYVEGLRKAGSPYAYHTLGSTIAVHYSHYAKVRGFPKRAAAEDFYLLNKLSKTGEILSLKSPVVQLIARESTRVPFGTGPAVIDLAAKTNPMNMPLYHPDSFCYLQIFIQLLDELSEKENIDIQSNVFNAVKKHSNKNIEAHVLMGIIDSIKLPTALAHCFRHGKKKSTRLQHLHHWFDGFRTLKFIHYLRDNSLGTTTFQQWFTENQVIDIHPLMTIVKRMNISE